MLMFGGRIIQNGSAWRYDFKSAYVDLAEDLFEYSSTVCSGSANAYLGGELKERFTEYASWGYEGRGSELTAAYMLRHSVGQSEAKDYAAPFAREVIDHLPDEWTMTHEEVREWIKKYQSRSKEKSSKAKAQAITASQ